MQDLGDLFIEALPDHIKNLKIPGRAISEHYRRGPIVAQIDNVAELQNAMREVLYHPATIKAHHSAESAFTALLEKSQADDGLLSFFNG